MDRYLDHPEHVLALEHVEAPAASPLDSVVMPSDVRARAVAMFRALADRIESGELDGGRIQWRAGLVEVERVELDGVPRAERLDDGSTRLVRSVRIETIDLLTGATREGVRE